MIIIKQKKNSSDEKIKDFENSKSHKLKISNYEIGFVTKTFSQDSETRIFEVLTDDEKTFNILKSGFNQVTPVFDQTGNIKEFQLVNTKNQEQQNRNLINQYFQNFLKGKTMNQSELITKFAQNLFEFVQADQNQTKSFLDLLSKKLNSNDQSTSGTKPATKPDEEQSPKAESANNFQHTDQYSSLIDTVEKYNNRTL